MENSEEVSRIRMQEIRCPGFVFNSTFHVVAKVKFGFSIAFEERLDISMVIPLLSILSMLVIL